MVSFKDFVAKPSLELLSALNKDQLWAVAEHYELIITAQEKKLKVTLFLAVRNQLIEKGILTEEGSVEQKDDSPESVGETAGSAAAAASPAAADADKQLQLEKLKGERDARALREKELDLELRKLDQQLELQRMEHDYALAMKKLELEGRQREPPPIASPLVSSQLKFDVCKNIRLVPPFSEKEVDRYFSHFERVATTLNWPKDVWPLPLQCALTGKAREVFSALAIEQARQYDVVKTTILRAYELVPEAYRQKFRNARKPEQQTFVEFAREKERLFDRWCSAQQVETKEDLRQLVLVEDFMNGLPESVAVHLKEQEVQKLDEAAVLADKYVLTHKRISDGRWPCNHDKAKLSPKTKQSVGGDNAPRPSPSVPSSCPPASKADVICFYCKKVGHKMSDCLALLRKKANNPKPSGLITSSGTRPLSVVAAKGSPDGGDADYIPFITNGFVSLSGQSPVSVPVRILRDTGAAQSFLLSEVLLLSGSTATGNQVVVRGFEMTPMLVPLHQVHLVSELITADVVVGVRPSLPIPGVSLILGNDLARARVWVNSNVVSPPIVRPVSEPPRTSDLCSRRYPDVFPACAVTRAMAVRGTGSDFVPLSDTFLAQPEVAGEGSSQLPVKEVKTANANPDDSVDVEHSDEEVESMEVVPPVELVNGGSTPTLLNSDQFGVCSLSDLFHVSREELIQEQLTDVTLEPLLTLASSKDKPEEDASCYCMQDGLLCRQWVYRQDTFSNTVLQVVVPSKFRKAVMELAHNRVAGHTGVRKTYDRIVRRFFWPRLKRDVSSYVRSCHVCQLTGKPNQKIPVAPLQPIPAVSNPFEHLIVDCVGPLPRSKAGHSFLLTVMCQSTRYPAAYPLRSITAKSVLKALVSFMSIFGIPKVIQSDQGSNFMSKQFSRALRQLKARHNISSAYHPQSQGALERFHQTLKSLLRSYCVELGSDWEEGLPWLLLATREVVQESMGFSPNELVFGHSVRLLSWLRSGALLPRHQLMCWTMLVDFAIASMKLGLLLSAGWVRPSLRCRVFLIARLSTVALSLVSKF